MAVAELTRRHLLRCAIILAASLPAVGLAADATIGTTSSGAILGASGGTAEISAGATVTNGFANDVVTAPAGIWALTNRGTITSDFADAVVLDGAGSSVINHGTIGGDFGNMIVLGHGGSVDNKADATITSELSAIILGNASTGGVNSVNNDGTITQTDDGGGDLVQLYGGGTVTNTGSISGANSSNAVSISDGSSRAVINSGSITNTGTGYATGVLLQGGASTLVNNAGGLISGSFNGVYASGSAPLDLTNDGSIRATGGAAGARGVEATGGGTFINRGTIESVSSDGLYLGRTGSVTNGGTIRGRSGLIFATGATGSTVVNSGTIEGTAGAAIALTNSNDSLTLMTGSTTTGAVDGRSGTDTLALDGMGTSTLDMGQFSNFETFSKLGSGKWTLGGNYTGALAATVSAGDLRINGTMGATNFTLIGGLLGGTGTVGTIAVASGAHVAPGNSVGTLHSGSVAFAAGSVFDVEVAGTTTDLLDITGTATITAGAIINVTGSLSNCSPFTQPLLTASGGRTGTFTLGSLLGSASLSYDANNVFLTMAGGRTFTGFTNTANQASTAAALDALGCGNQPYTAEINALTDAQVPAAMDALSGEGHAAIAATFLQTSDYLSDTIDARIEQAFAALDGRGTVTAFAPGPMLLESFTNATVWASGYGGYAAQAANGNASGTSSAASGLVLGADGKVTEDWRMGLIAGLGLTGISSGATTGSSVDTSVGGYAGAELGVVTIKIGAAYTRHFIGTTRSIVFPGVNDMVTASYQAGTAQAFFEIGTDFDVEDVTVSPFAKFLAVNHATDAFTETGGAGGALATAASVSNALFVTLGVAAEDKFALSDTMLVTARGSLGWQHAFADAPTVANSFAGGGPFMVSSVPVASDVAVLSAELVFEISDAMNVAASYDGMLGSGYGSSSVRATLAGKF